MSDNPENKTPQVTSSRVEFNKRSCSRCNTKKCDVIEHIPADLEEEVSQLRSTHRSPCGSDVNPTSDLDGPSNLAKKTELLVLKEGKSRYVSDEVSVTLGEKISELRDIIESDSNEEDCSPNANSSSTVLPQGGLFGGDKSYYGWSFESFRCHYSQAARIKALWKLYQENVAPLITIVHQDTISQIVQYASAGVDMTHPDEVLLFCVYYAAVASMRAHLCHSILDVDHDTAIQDCKRAVSQGLRHANFIKCQNISVFQGAVLFLLCYRVGGDIRLVWAESAVVIRVAQAQGIHRDGQNFALPPFETAIRRRLWWHICLLDMLSSRDQDVDTQIRPGMFDTQFPTNVDDDLILHMPNLPMPKSGFTDNSLCIMNSQIMPNFHDDRVFKMAVEIVQFAYLLQTNEATSQWSWLCQSYKEWYVAFILSELCFHPLNPDTDHAWDIVSKMYELWQRGIPHTDAVLHKPLDRLMQRTAASRETKKLQHKREPPVQENLPYSVSLGFGEHTISSWMQFRNSPVWTGFLDPDPSFKLLS
ncbi:hypothetical protein N7444_001391 [Penicillium canescens]|nr:hypothetical protein N7444_001391 [Penicillium canescens]